VEDNVDVETTSKTMSYIIYNVTDEYHKKPSTLREQKRTTQSVLRYFNDFTFSFRRFPNISQNPFHSSFLWFM